MYATLPLCRKLLKLGIKPLTDKMWVIRKSGSGNLNFRLRPRASVADENSSEVERVNAYSDEELRKRLYLLTPDGWSAPRHLKAKTNTDLMALKIAYLIENNLT